MSSVLAPFFKINFVPVSAKHIMKKYQFIQKFSNHIRFVSGGNVDVNFQTAQETLNTLKTEPGSDVKLKIYALFKQATKGKNTTPKPSAFNFVSQAKWTAWNSLGSMSQDDAKKEYAEIIKNLAQSEHPNEGNNEGNNVKPIEQTPNIDNRYQCLQVSEENNITKIVLNRPSKKNALTREMYEEIINALREAAEDNSAIVVITGSGDYFCSGNDLGNFSNISPDKMKEIAVESGDLLRRYVAAYIDFPKPLIAAVNGPAIGVAVTVLGLFDIVYAAENATFSTPFSNLGQSPEGCSTHTFPKIMGYSKSCEMMLFNKKLTAREAYACGLVTAVFPTESFQNDVNALLSKMADLPVKSLVYSKALMRDPEKEALHEANRAECERLVERWTSDDCLNAIMKFFSRKS